MRAAEIGRLRRVYDGRQAPEVTRRYALSRPGVRYLRQRRERAIRYLLARQGITDLSALRILDLGCGRGRNWPNGSIAAAGDELLFADATFDIVEQSMLFSSILDGGMRAMVAAEALRVVKPGGLVLWYDFRVGNPRNADLRPVSPAKIARLFPGCRIDLRRVTPLTLALGALAFSLGRVLETLPPLRTHYLGTTQRP